MQKNWTIQIQLITLIVKLTTLLTANFGLYNFVESQSDSETLVQNLIQLVKEIALQINFNLI